MNRKMLLGAAALLLIAGSWIGNLTYYNSLQLEEPLFLKHYEAVNGAGGEPIEIRYLENKSDPGRVAWIQIEELPMLGFELVEDERFSHHRLMKAYAYWDGGTGAPDLSLLPITVREVTVHYRGGVTRKVPIGEVVVTDPARGGMVDMISSGGSSDGSGFSSNKVTQPAVLERIDYSFSDRLNTGFQLELDGKPIEEAELPAALKAGDRLNFRYNWEHTVDDPASYEHYQIKLLLHFRTADGRAIVDRIPVNRNVYLSESMVKRLVRSGGDVE